MTGDERSARHWDEVYRTRAVDVVSWYQPAAGTSLRLLGLPADPGDRPRSVVDVGAGASVLVDGLLEAGVTDLTLLDVSAAALETTRHRLEERSPEQTAGVRLVVCDVLDWEPGRTYDAWHDRAVLHFLTDPADRRRYVETATAAVVRGGVLVLGGFAPDGPTHCSGLPTVRRSAAELAGELAAGFDLEHAEREEHRTPGGDLQAFTWVRLRRR